MPPSASVCWAVEAAVLRMRPTLSTRATHAWLRWLTCSRINWTMPANTSTKCSRPRAIQQLMLRRPSLVRSEEHTSELQSHSDLVCRLLLAKKQTQKNTYAKNYVHK